MKIKAKQLPEDCGVTNGKIYDVLEEYEHGYRIMSDDGEEVNIHRKNCEVINSHPHADLILKYAMIAQYDAEPWLHFDIKYNGKWVDLQFPPIFDSDSEYRLKPRTININGFEVPEPLRSVPAHGKPYFIPDMIDVLDIHWNNHPDEYQMLKAGVIHLTREAAEKHLEALLSFTKE